MVDVDPQHAGPEIGQILAGDVGIRSRRAVARGDVEIAVVAEAHVAAVVPGRRPFDDHLAAFGKDDVRRLRADAEAHDLVVLVSRPVQVADVAKDVNQMVLQIIRMKDERENLRLFLLAGRKLQNRRSLLWNWDRP